MKYIAHKAEDGREQLLIDHLKNVGDFVKLFADKFGTAELGYLIGLFHDIGKYSDDFQKRIRGSNIHVDHSTAGGQLLYKQNSNQLGQLAAYCIMGHHSGLPNGGSSSDEEDESTLKARLRRKLPDYSACEIEITSLDAPNFIPNDLYSASFLTRLLFSALTDGDWLDTEGFMSDGKIVHGGFDSIDVLKEKFDRRISAYLHPSNKQSAINMKRNELLKDCISAGERESGLYTLTAPTGSGKTLSSMAFALTHAVKNKKDRVIYVIPYNTIIEQNAKVFEDILGPKNIVQHHSNINYDTNEDGPDYHKVLATENWDAPIIVTSSVQFFESMYANKPSSCRKLHNIANSVIVLDEAQMIPLPYLLPCVRALKELIINYNVTVVLATATQSSLDEYFKPLIPTEIVKNPKEMYDFFRRVTYKRIEGVLSNEDIANRLSKHNQVLCVVNTRRRAQKIAELLGDGDEVFHLSTTMYPAHRSSVLKEIKARLKNSKPCRVVSTSMIEAGVDIDFPVLYREKAGLDSIIQAAGRCNREGEQSAGESLVYVFETEGSSPRIIKQNIAAYDYAERENEDIASLDAIETYFRQLRYIIGQEGLDKKSVVEKFNSSSMFPFKDVAEDFHLIDDSTKTVIIPNTPEAIELVDKLRKGERSRDILRELQQYSVSLYEKTDIKQLDEYGAIARIDEKILVLSVESYYNSKYGVTLSSKGGI